jgi:hypothetical protein
MLAASLPLLTQSGHHQSLPISLCGAANPHLAPALLNHTDSAVTNEHYNRASSLTAAASLREVMQKHRRRRCEAPFCIRLEVQRPTLPHKPLIDGGFGVDRANA